MKKYILSLFALIMFLTPVIGLSANGLTEPGTVDGEKQTLLYRLFYKEHRITSNDSIAYEDSDGTEHSFNDIFESNNLAPSSTENFGTSLDSENNFEFTDESLSDRELIYERTSDNYYMALKIDSYDFSNVSNLDGSANYVWLRAHYSDKDQSITNKEDSDTSYIDFKNGQHLITRYGSNEYDNYVEDDLRLRFDNNSSGDYSMEGQWFNIDMSQFETVPSESNMDTYFDVYLTVEEGETYYYYTFDGGFISILWVAVLFSGSYLYIRKAEVEDTKQAIIQASIFFIIGLVLLRVIQTII